MTSHAVQQRRNLRSIALAAVLAAGLTAAAVPSSATPEPPAPGNAATAAPAPVTAAPAPITPSPPSVPVGTGDSAAPGTGAATATAGSGAGAGPPSAEPTPEVVVEAPEPKYVAPTLRDRIGRIWAPVLINGKGPYRLVLDTGASHSAIIGRVAESLGISPKDTKPILVRGVTGEAMVAAIKVDRMEVGELLIAPTTLPIVADVFGGAEGVLGREGLPDKRIYADFAHDRLVIAHSHRERAQPGFAVIPLKLTRTGLLAAEVRVGTITADAIIDTGGQQTVGNLSLRDALMRHPPKDATTQEIEGVTLEIARGNVLTAPPINMGSLRLKQVRVTFADMYLFDHLKLNREPTLLLGMDVLGSFDVLVIDYRLRQMQIRMRNADSARSASAASGG
ncbi:MAG TPA: retroviral-like aspartic protease family protein [Steroidobacteraceae bacterium]|nr:retroviral-like aspartic protease family protein [Steroidobacteraceae bacterium]